LTKTLHFLFRRKRKFWNKRRQLLWIRRRQWVLIFCVDVHVEMIPSPHSHAPTWAWPTPCGRHKWMAPLSHRSKKDTYFNIRHNIKWKAIVFCQTFRKPSKRV